MMTEEETATMSDLEAAPYWRELAVNCLDEAAAADGPASDKWLDLARVAMRKSVALSADEKPAENGGAVEAAPPR